MAKGKKKKIVKKYFFPQAKEVIEATSLKEAQKKFNKLTK